MNYLERMKALADDADDENVALSEPERRAHRAQAVQLAVLSIAESLAAMVAFIEEERGKEDSPDA